MSQSWPLTASQFAPRPFLIHPFKNPIWGRCDMHTDGGALFSHLTLGVWLNMQRVTLEKSTRHERHPLKTMSNYQIISRWKTKKKTPQIIHNSLSFQVPCKPSRLLQTRQNRLASWMNYTTSSEMRSAPLERSISCPTALSTTVKLLSAVSISRPDEGRRRLAAERPSGRSPSDFPSIFPKVPPLLLLSII